jgi:hypothetical protein
MIEHRDITYLVTSRSLDRRARGLSRDGPEAVHTLGYRFSVQLTTAKLTSLLWLCSAVMNCTEK